jgi:hypothetical protein
MEPIQDDQQVCPTCGLTYWKNLCRDPYHTMVPRPTGEPIQDDIETVRKTLVEFGHGNWTYPLVPALAALDRLVAERDRLIQALEEFRNRHYGSMTDEMNEELLALTKTTEEQG